jgi:hypothetical protein
MHRLKNVVLFIPALAGIIFCCSCEKYTLQDNPLSDADSVKFSRDIRPILIPCAACHDGPNKPNLQDNPYQSLKSANYLNVANPAQSKLYVTLKTETSHSSKVSPTQMQKILQWIKQGARNN